MNQIAEIIELVGQVLDAWDPQHDDGDYPCRAVKYNEAERKWGCGSCNCGAQESIDLSLKLKSAISKWMDDPVADEAEAKQHTRLSLAKAEIERYKFASETSDKQIENLIQNNEKLANKLTKLEAENHTLKQAASIWAASALAPKKPISEQAAQLLDQLGKAPCRAGIDWCQSVEKILELLCKQ